MVALGVVERPRLGDLGRDLAVAGLGQLALEHLARRQHRVALPVVRVVDRGPVLRAGVVPLPHALGRVVALPEDLEHLLVARPGRVEDGEDDLRVAGPAGADLLVRRVRREAARIAGCRRVHARRLPEHPLGAPEAAHADDDGPEALGERRRQRSAEDEVRLARHDRRLATGQRGLARRQLVLSCEEHVPKGIRWRSARYGVRAASQPSYSPPCSAASRSNHVRNAGTVAALTTRWASARTSQCDVSSSGLVTVTS